MKTTSTIQISGAHENNLKAVSLEIPHHQFIVITGVSGSGKSSLAFDTIAAEGRRRFMETLPSFSRQFLSKMNPPKVAAINGLSAVITVGQKISTANQRATVGTLSETDSWLRLLFARVGTSTTHPAISPNRSLFSANAKAGMCERCNGLGKEEQIDTDKLIANPTLTLRQGALAPTLKTGYIMYSQVTIDVLNDVCNAEGFDVDTPWNKLSEKEQAIVLHGSEKIKVLFGKHSLESRLKWTGMKAKPREEGYYKGLYPIMADILKRDRNPSILKYVSAVTCPACNGKKLNAIARSFKVGGQSIVALVDMHLMALKKWLLQLKTDAVSHVVVKKMIPQLNQLIALGIGHLKPNQPLKNCTLSEVQRIRVANQLLTNLSSVLYVFDEPSIGLSQTENAEMIRVLKQLVGQGNTVIVVEHDLDTIRSADWIVDIGPEPGKNGGELIFNGTYADFLKDKKVATASLTHKALHKKIERPAKPKPTKTGRLIMHDCKIEPFFGETFTFKQHQLNVITGGSSHARAVFIKQILVADQNNIGRYFNRLKSDTPIHKIIHVDQAPIGRTPRSNPATYLKISDHIRDLFASLPEAKANGLKKSHFSFNTKGGRCETCEGAGKIRIGLHYLGNVDLNCETCNGKRFKADVLTVAFNQKNIAAIYELSVNEALSFFKEYPKVTRGLELLAQIGLGYLQLGQSSTTLSGGEAQRIKIANELQKNPTHHCLYFLAEPSIGLHPYDSSNLLRLFNTIVAKGHTIICLDQDEMLVDYADQVVHLKNEKLPKIAPENNRNTSPVNNIQLKGITTNLLQNISVTFPKNKRTVVTGLSGSGKSSLVYDTLFATANSRFMSSLSAYNRSLFTDENNAKLDEASGLTPTIALGRTYASPSRRSTVGTRTEILTHLRLLFSRIAQQAGFDYSAQHFSFNSKLGACHTCQGTGIVQTANPNALIEHPEKSIFEGALTTNKAAEYYTNPASQFMATLKTVAASKNWNLNVPWNTLTKTQKTIILNGTGDEKWDVTWTFKNKTRAGEQNINTAWKGFCNYINEEYELKKNSKSKERIATLMQTVNCPVCAGARLKPALLAIQFKGYTIHEIGELEFATLDKLLAKTSAQPAFVPTILTAIKKTLKALLQLGLDYLTLNRLTQTLSGGEFQRVRIAGQIAANLYGVTYILDEPTLGLDTHQISVLDGLLRQLTEQGNTVIVIEHAVSFIKSADYIVELGPESGKDGGQLMFQGSLSELSKYPKSKTFQLLQGALPVPAITADGLTEKFGVKGAVKNNLKRVDASFACYQINSIIGKSGSGKSSLLRDVLYPSFKTDKATGCAAIFGNALFDDVHFIDQRPFALNQLATPATFTGIYDRLRTLFAASHGAKEKGLKKTDFSFQSKKGRCPNCNGYGEIRTAMDYMPDVWTQCNTCCGKRYSQLILSCTMQWQNEQLSLGDVLQKTMTELAQLATDKRLKNKLEICQRLGVGHLLLGQAGNTVSSGEAQRLKLAKVMMDAPKNQLFLFDEPGNGLHYFDLMRLMEVFKTIVEQNNTIIYIEHNQQLIDFAQQQVELEPESGHNGGQIIRQTL